MGQTTTRSIPVARGLMYDRRGRLLVENVPTFVLRIVPAELPFEVRPEVADRLSRLTDIPARRIIERLDAHVGLAVRAGAHRRHRDRDRARHQRGPGVCSRASRSTSRRAGDYPQGRSSPTCWAGPAASRGPSTSASRDQRLLARGPHRQGRPRGHVRGRAARQLRPRGGRARRAGPRGPRPRRPREPVAGRLAGADHRHERPAERREGAALGHGRRGHRPRRGHGHEPAERRDPGHGLAAQLRQQRVRAGHLHGRVPQAARATRPARCSTWPSASSTRPARPTSW